ncbi:oxidoreductase [Fusarium heterosporum]|uniref:Oxidoreductase n=1 Tax=Fusarium heterosporum TaxID=42747 RepID=A0A8H5WJ69_FUSHE|nr:oxidoreductase [Fusarium heterosporum]
MTPTTEAQNRSVVLPHVKAYPMVITASPIAVPTGNEVLIRVRAVAINPADHAVQKLGVVIKPDHYPYVNGVDVSGDVVSVGPYNKRFQPGNRVTAQTSAWQKGETKYGAFQEYAIIIEPMVAKIPDNISYQEAAVLPLGFTTSSAMLYSPELMGLDLPGTATQVKSTQKVVLVWGGSSSVGANAVQTLKAAGYKVAVTASERNHGMMRAINADHIFDYNNDGIVEEIMAALIGMESAGIYCAVESASALRACASIADNIKGKKCVGTVLPPSIPLPEGLPDSVEMLINDRVHFGSSETGRILWAEWLPGALEDGSMRCMPYPEVVGKGLESIQSAVDLMGRGVSGKKLVVEF